MRILHVLPDTAADPKQRFLGSTKDLRGRTEYFRERGMEVEELVVPRRKDSALLPMLKARDLSGFDAVFLELPIYPASMGYLRKAHPRLKLLVRPINAEFYHHLHYIVSGLKHGYWKRTARYALFAFHRLYQDYACARRADYVLSITEWESWNYWHRLAGKGKTLTVPYFVPDSYKEDADSAPAKEELCVCLLSTIMNSFLADSARNFHRALESLGPDMPAWTFHVTGRNPPRPDRPLPRLVATGLLDSPFNLMVRARAMALLSDFGFGFKTKILDAILVKSYVLVTSKLHARLAPVLHPFCFVVDPDSKESFRIALEACLKPFPAIDANSVLRAEAFAALDRAFAP